MFNTYFNLKQKNLLIPKTMNCNFKVLTDIFIDEN